MKSTKNNNKSTSNKSTSFSKNKDHSFFNPTPFFGPQTIQPKLTVGAAGDKYEKEADAVADRVVNQINQPTSAASPIATPKTPTIQMKCSACNEEHVQKMGMPKDESSNSTSKTKEQKEEEQSNGGQDRPNVMTKSNGQSNASSSLSSQLSSSKGGGNQLATPIANKMGQAIGSNFSNVRIHTNNKAVEMNRGLNARAFTHGSDIYFNKGQYNPQSTEGQRLLAHELTHVVQQKGQQPFSASGNPQKKVSPKLLNMPANSIQRVPAPGRNFGTYNYCGFGITSAIPGFIQNYVTDNYNVDYTSGCSWIWGNAWKSIWELYDASDRKIDSSTRNPFGDYDIPRSKINSGVAGDASARWSLWYRVNRSQPWLTSDNDAYPYHYKTFPVYQFPIKNPRTTLRTEYGPIVSQNNFTPGANGASMAYNISTNITRNTTNSQTTSVSATASGSQSQTFGFSFEGLTGGFTRSLNLSATASISRTHSLSVQSSRSESYTYTQPNLQAGVTYRMTIRPLYHLLDGSVDVINHRDGIVINNNTTQSSGMIRILKGIDIRIEPVNNTNGNSTTPQVTPTTPGQSTPQRTNQLTDPTATTGGPVSMAARGRWSCDASCNVAGGNDHCTGRVTGSSSGHSSENDACREAKRDATQKAPRGCYARHCRCLNCTR